jgi:hypothetical protein
MMLHLPYVAELVRDQVVLLAGAHGVAQQDQAVGGIAVEAAQPRQPEERRPHRQPDAGDADRARVRVEPVEPRTGTLERGPLGAGHPRLGGSKTSQTPPS